MYKSHHLRKNRVSMPFHYYSVTTVTHARNTLFTSFDIARISIQNLYLMDEQQDTKTICFVVMPDHIHWLFQLQDKLSLPQTVAQFKGRSARAVRVFDCNVEKVWQDDYFEHCFRNENDLLKQARYIVANPLRAQLVESIGHYPFWNCVYL
jgi:putative transposase